MVFADRSPTGAAPSPSLRLWVLPFIVTLLFIIDSYFVGLESIFVTAVAAGAIVVFGIPHGSLDVEIAGHRFGYSSLVGKVQITVGYLVCAAFMMVCWRFAPALALSSFLLVSIVHFSQDWRKGAEPFLAMMVGWGLVSVPALSHPDIVSDIFILLTDNPSGETIASLLAIASAPAALGCLVYALWAYRNGNVRDAVDVLSCLAAALLLPPLIAFAIFFCGLHSPRHMASALEDAGTLSAPRKLAVIIAVTLLALGLGAALFAQQVAFGTEANIIRTAFILISILTVPHFLLEHMLAKSPLAAGRRY